MDIARTLGAIGDVLADTGISYYSLGLVGAEAIRFEASVLASLHLTARWSRSTLEEQSLASTRGSLMTSLNDLIILTEPWALIPPAQRASAFDHVRLPNPAAPGIEGAVVAWAGEAWQILHDRHRATGFHASHRRHLAVLSLLAGDARCAKGDQWHASDDRRLAETSAATQAWRAAATRPPNLRLAVAPRTGG